MPPFVRPVLLPPCAVPLVPFLCCTCCSVALGSGLLSIVGTYWLDVKKVQRQVQGKQFRLFKGMGPAMGAQAFRTGAPPPPRTRSAPHVPLCWARNAGRQQARKGENEQHGLLGVHRKRRMREPLEKVNGGARGRARVCVSCVSRQSCVCPVLVLCTTDRRLVPCWDMSLV